MSLDKAIQHKKEKRKQYSGAKAVDPCCRNHGSCPYCTQTRLHNRKKAELSAEEKINSYKKEIFDDSCREK